MDQYQKSIIFFALLAFLLTTGCEGQLSRECFDHGEIHEGKCVCLPGYNSSTNCEYCNDGGNITDMCLSCLNSDFHFDQTLHRCEKNLARTTVTGTTSVAPASQTTTITPTPRTSTKSPTPPVTTTSIPHHPTTTAKHKVTKAPPRAKDQEGLGIGAVLGIIFGSLALLGGAVFGFMLWRRRNGGDVARHSLSFYGGSSDGREYSLI